MALNGDVWQNLSYTKKVALLGSLRTDCSFIIGRGVNAKIIGAHKSILSRGSTVFESMFNGNYQEANNDAPIPLPNVEDFADFKVILEHVYYKKMPLLDKISLERLKHVSYLADYFLLDEIVTNCHIKVVKYAAENVINLYDFVQLFEYEKRHKLDSIYVKTEQRTSIPLVEFKNTCWFDSKELLQNSSIYDLSGLDFYDLLLLPVLKLTEIERFILIENYAKINNLNMDEFVVNKLGGDGDDGDNAKIIPPSKDITLNEMFDLINFSKMTEKEFKKGPASSRIWNISPEEKLEISLQLCKV
ncbi:BTB/POZ domain-containing protein 2-like isoform X1 [Ceratitis capitata]|nr:BTB/POZ domain-containing protein 2-like isoform X1 [Ceratitis capitata]